MNIEKLNLIEAHKLIHNNDNKFFYEVKEFRKKAVNLGVIDKKWNLLLAYALYDKINLSILQNNLHILEKLILDLPNRLFNGNFSAFLKLLKINENLIQFSLPLCNSLHSFPIRWDMIPTEYGWKILELNSGYCLGGLNGYHLSKDIKKIIKNECNRIPNAFLNLIKQIKSQFNLPSNSKIAILETDKVINDYNFYLNSLVRGLNQYSDFEFIAGSLSEIKKINGNLFLKNQLITAFIPMFTIEELFEDIHYGKIIVDSIILNDIACLLNLKEHFFSNKGVLAILKDPKYHPYFSSSEILVINSLIPKTYYITNNNYSKFMNGDYVIKPTNSYGGEEVICSWEVSKSEWLEILNKCNPNKIYIIQEKVTGISLDLCSIDTDENIIEGISKPVIGIIMIDNIISGSLIRSHVNSNEISVVNAHRGAAIGLMEIEEE